jgi:uncharacterized membrane protein
MFWPRSALLVGAVLLSPRGTHTHRMIGTVYVLALVLVNVAALSLHRENAFGVFHALAVASLVTIGVGLSPLLVGNRSPTVIATHAYCMTWLASFEDLICGFGPDERDRLFQPVTKAQILAIRSQTLWKVPR